MAKKQGWENGEGPYSSSKNIGITRYRGELAEADDFSDSKDISKIVDENAAVNGGASGALKR